MIEWLDNELNRIISYRIIIIIYNNKYLIGFFSFEIKKNISTTGMTSDG